MVNVHDGHTYFIVNAKGGTAIDLSGDDNYTIHGWERHRSPLFKILTPKQWTTHRTDDGWHIRNVATGKFLALAGHATDDVAVVGSDEPFTWHFWPENDNEDEIRVCVPGTRHDLDLNDHGNPNNGTPIKVWGRWEGRNQVWCFESA